VDTLTHALSGALLAHLTAGKDAPPRSIPRRVSAGFFAAAAPDLDFVLALGSPLLYLEQRRGPTRSFILLPFWALALSWALAKILREPRGWRALYGVTALGLGIARARLPVLVCREAGVRWQERGLDLRVVPRPAVRQPRAGLGAVPVRRVPRERMGAMARVRAHRRCKACRSALNTCGLHTISRR
jgi:hypothetical protein